MGVLSLNRRKNKRYSIPLKLSYLDETDNRWKDSLATDISSTGLRFTVEKKIPKGATLNLMIEDPFSDRLNPFTGQITWVGEVLSGKDKDARVEIGVKIFKKSVF